MAKSELLQDFFATQDTAKWTFDGAASVSGGQLVLPCVSDYSSGIFSAARQDLTASYINVQLVTRPNLGTGTTEALLYAEASTGNQVSMSVSGSLLYFSELVGGTDDSTSLTFNATTHKYWQIREAGGTVFWETSTTGATGSWTTRRSKTTTLNLTSVSVGMMCGYYGTEASPGSAVLDDFNGNTVIVGPTPQWVLGSLPMFGGPEAPLADSAAVRYGWGSPVRQTNFVDDTDLVIPDGPGHAGNGTRSPAQVSFGVNGMRIDGNTTGDSGAATYLWNQPRPGFRIEIRMRCDPDPLGLGGLGTDSPLYHPVLLTWPTDDDWAANAEIDFCEILPDRDPAPRRANLYLHYITGDRAHSEINVDYRDWHNWAVAWKIGAYIRVYCDGNLWGEVTNPGDIPSSSNVYPSIQLDNFFGTTMIAGWMETAWLREYGPPP